MVGSRGKGIKKGRKKRTSLYKTNGSGNLPLKRVVKKHLPLFSHSHTWKKLFSSNKPEREGKKKKKKVRHSKGRTYNNVRETGQTGLAPTPLGKVKTKRTILGSEKDGRNIGGGGLGEHPTSIPYVHLQKPEVTGVLSRKETGKVSEGGEDLSRVETKGGGGGGGGGGTVNFFFVMRP